MERSSTRMRVAPRQPIRPASVTTSEGSPRKATHMPCSRPAPAPASMATAIASQNGAPPSCIAATTAAEKPITDATERSISPLMITKAMTTAMITFSTERWNRFPKLSAPR